MAAIIVAVRHVRSHWPEIRMYYLERQCLAHPIPPGVQVYSSARPLATFSSPEFDAFYRNFPKDWAQYGIPSPGYSPSTLSRTKSITSFPVYLGSRRASNGCRRFIAIYGLGIVNQSEAGIMLCGVSRPTGLASAEKQGQNFLVDSWEGSFDATHFATPDALVYSAVEDSADESHFKITFDLSGVHVTVDCFLQPDGSLIVKRNVPYWSPNSDTKARIPLNPTSDPILSDETDIPVPH